MSHRDILTTLIFDTIYNTTKLIGNSTKPLCHTRIYTNNATVSKYIGITYHLSLSLWLYSPLNRGRFFGFLLYIQSVGLLGRRSARREASTCTQNNKNIREAHTYIHASNGIRTNDPNDRAGEGG
jgi:hypothetical protein